MARGEVAMGEPAHSAGGPAFVSSAAAAPLQYYDVVQLAFLDMRYRTVSEHVPQTPSGLR